MSRVRIGIAGAGGMGKHHARILSARDDTQIVALFDTDPVAMNRLEKSLGVSVQALNHYSSLSAMIDSDKLDGLVIATPHTRHADQVRTGLEAGLHVLVEKPMALSLEHCDEMIAAAESNNVKLMAGYSQHFYGTSLKAKEILDSEYWTNAESKIKSFLASGHTPEPEPEDAPIS